MRISIQTTYLKPGRTDTIVKIFRDLRLIEEDYRVNEGLVEFDSERLKIDLAAIEQTAVVALVGDYGAGKSTALHNIAKEASDKDSLWLQFDAWRYPERKGLWDGLVIEVAKQLGTEASISRKVDGNKSALGKWGSIVGEIFVQANEVLPDIKIADKLIEGRGASKVAKVASRASELFGRSPAKRAYDFEQILADLLIGVDSNTVYIVAEDTDRSGRDGMNFLETINFFLKNNKKLVESDKKVIVIAPVGTDHYRVNKQNYYKCVDIALRYEPTVKSVDKFIDAVFSDELLSTDDGMLMTNLVEFVSEILSSKSYDVSIRSLKAILRQSYQAYSRLLATEKNVDWRAVLVVEAMRSIQYRNDITLLDHANSTGAIAGGSIFSGLLLTIHEPKSPLITQRIAGQYEKTDRLINKRAQSYTFAEYTAQADSSVWLGVAKDGFSTRGYIADYYKS